MERKIGDAAGTIWNALQTNGALSLGQVCKVARIPRAVANQGIGWLAREGKLSVEQGQNGVKLLKLRP